MKRLSINIPTYNRGIFLEKNLEIIVRQLKTDDLINEVEVNISDNASTDNTEGIVTTIIHDNPEIDFNYIRNGKNIGPDLNFISAMKMAKGEYSILFGDDDFFEPGAIKKLLNIAYANKGVDIFFSNRITINSDGNLTGYHRFMRKDAKTEIFNFSHLNDGRAFFSLVTDLGGLLTFISSDLYKTSIINDVGDYDDRCTGSNYSFLFYFWSKLAKGGRIMYLDDYFVRATAQGATNNNYGIGINRLLVDTDGLFRIADVVFHENSNTLKADFLAAVKKSLTKGFTYNAYFSGDENQRLKFRKSAILCGWSDEEIDYLDRLFSLKAGLKIILKQVLPTWMKGRIHLY